MKTMHLLIHGKVQGVFYRASAKEQADLLSLSGWIRNTEDGSVEAVVTGTEENIDSFISWCRKGPKQAVVNDIQVTPKPDEGLKGFKVIRSC
jgi:acylphosphatase